MRVPHIDEDGDPDADDDDCDDDADGYVDDADDDDGDDMALAKLTVFVEPSLWSQIKQTQSSRWKDAKQQYRTYEHRPMTTHCLSVPQGEQADI